MSVCQKRHYLSVLVCRTRYTLHAFVVLLVSMILGIPLKIYHLPQGILKSAQLIEPDIHCIILFFFAFVLVQECAVLFCLHTRFA